MSIFDEDWIKDHTNILKYNVDIKYNKALAKALIPGLMCKKVTIQHQLDVINEALNEVSRVLEKKIK